MYFGPGHLFLGICLPEVENRYKHVCTMAFTATLLMKADVWKWCAVIYGCIQYCLQQCIHKNLHSRIFERRENSHGIIREKCMLGVVQNATFMKKKPSILLKIFVYFYTYMKYKDTCTHEYLDFFL